jgi:hypothetical protein
MIIKIEISDERLAEIVWRLQSLGTQDAHLCPSTQVLEAVSKWLPGFIDRSVESIIDQPEWYLRDREQLDLEIDNAAFIGAELLLA